MNTAIPVMIALAATLQTQPGAPLTTAVRGIAGEIAFSDGGPRLRARADQTLTSPLVVRVLEAKPEASGSTRYRIAFIGIVTGEHDVREYLEREDGSPADLPPLRVTVHSQLSPEHGTDLFSSTRAPLLTSSRYRAAVAAIGGIWLGLPVAYFTVKRLRRKPVAPFQSPPPPPTLADQLRPLVEAAHAGTLSVGEQGRLELLLYLYWRARLDLPGRQAEVVSQLRSHADAGALLRTVEEWLHAARAPSPAPGSRIAELLRPYTLAPAIAPSLAGGAA